MAKEFGRSERVSSQMQKELALVFQRDVKDSRVGFITINEVIVSKDLAVAKVYFTVLNANEDQKKSSAEILEKLTPEIRHHLTKRMRLRHIPELRFIYDHSFDTGMKVSELLNETKKD